MIINTVLQMFAALQVGDIVRVGQTIGVIDSIQREDGSGLTWNLLFQGGEKEFVRFKK